MKRLLKMDSVQDYNDNLGVETLHPLVSVVDMSELEEVRHSLNRCWTIILHQTIRNGWDYLLYPGVPANYVFRPIILAI